MVLVQRRGRDCCLVVVAAMTRKEAVDVTGAVCYCRFFKGEEIRRQGC
jgi:hypothetical protein